MTQEGPAESVLREEAIESMSSEQPSEVAAEFSTVPTSETRREEPEETEYEPEPEPESVLDEERVPTEPTSPMSEPEAASRPTIQQAIDQVTDVIEALRKALDDMEQVLEMLEEVERQSSGDQREIESLRRALRQLHRPREGGHSHRGR